MELVLVHITDIHLENDTDYNILEGRSEYIANAINKHIIDETNTLLILCITGDIAYSGKEEQYLFASIFISDIIAGIKKRYNDLFIQIVTVPGNHDCDFDREDSVIRESVLRDSNLDIEGKYYVCGTGRQPLLRTKTENEQYYLLTLAAIAQEIRFRKAPRKAEVVLAAGLPLTSFGREKKNFRDYLLERKNPVVFEYEGELYEIRVLDVRLFPQGYSVVAMHPEIIRDEPSVLLVDIGGWTIDIMRLDNGVPNAATCRSLEMGVIRCQDEILEQVRRDTGLSITEVQVERVLNGKSCSISEEAKNIILTYGRQYVKRIVSAIMEAGFDLQAVPAVFLGGGARLFERNVSPQDRLCRLITLPDVCLNAAGFERLAGQILKR